MIWNESDTVKRQSPLTAYGSTYSTGYVDGVAAGHRDGYRQGVIEGEESGYRAGFRDCKIRMLSTQDRSPSQWRWLAAAGASWLLGAICVLAWMAAR